MATITAAGLQKPFYRTAVGSGTGAVARRLFLGMYPRLPSRPGDLHPEALTDPDVNLSIHPARATE